MRRFVFALAAASALSLPAADPLFSEDFEQAEIAASAMGAAKGAVVEGGRDSAHAFEISGRQEIWNGLQFDVTAKVAEGGAFVASAWVRQDELPAAEFNMMLHTRDGGGDRYDRIGTVRAQKGRWANLAGDFRVGRGVSACQPYVEMASSRGAFRVDGVSCARVVPRVPLEAPADPRPSAALARAAGKLFRVGVALNGRLVSEPTPAEAAAIRATFNSITPENELKPDFTQREKGRFTFDAGDRFVALGESMGAKIIGHCLVWSEQTPAWMNRTPEGRPLPREEAVANMRAHIRAVVGRYKGRIHGWDVVNEAFDDWGTLRTDSFWFRSIGPDYIELAFRFAHEADPDAELYYNDFGMANAAKCNGVAELVRRLKKKGVRIDAVGMQSHVAIDWPTAGAYERSIRTLAEAGVKVCVTELDVSVLPAAWGLSADITKTHDYQAKYDPYRAGLPEDVARRLSLRYRELFDLYARHAKVIDRVTFWGLHDGASWLNEFPVRGRTDYPLPYDRACKPKKCLTDTVRMLGGRK